MRKRICGILVVLFGVIVVSWNVDHSAVSKTSMTSPVNEMTNPGEEIFRENCASCHQVDGSGVPHMTPPLIGTKYVLGDKTRLIKILLEGLNEDLEIEGDHFTNPMPSFSYLKDQEIADVLTFIRNSFGNKAEPVSPTEVKAVREDNNTSKK